MYCFKWSYHPRSYERNFCNCVKKPEKFRTTTGFEPVTSRYRCDATDVRNWLFVGSNVPVRNESTMIYHFIVDSFLTGTLEPTNDQLPKLEMSTNFELNKNNKGGLPPPPFFVKALLFFCKRVLDGTSSFVT